MDINTRDVLNQFCHQSEKNDSTLFNRLFEMSTDGIFHVDRNLKYQYTNTAMSSMFGIHSGQHVDAMNSTVSMPKEMGIAWNNAIKLVFESGGEQSFEYRAMHGQRQYCFSAFIIPEKGSGGNIDSALGIVYDVSRREKMEKEHEALLNREGSARIEAETAARARDEFLAIVSHELRAPLNGIQTWAHVLETIIRDTSIETASRRALNGIKAGVHQQVRLIEDLWDVTRMMSGKLRLIRHPFTVLPVIQSAVQSIHNSAIEKNLRIYCDLQITAEQIDGDPDRIQQILWNLLSNAVKFTPSNGNIWTSAKSNASHIQINIRDTGIGIPSAFLPYLFDRFSQADTTSTRRHSGLGLGLFIVKHLSELHGGSVNVESAGENMGTSFTINLPLRSNQFAYMSTLQSGDNELVGPLPTLNGIRIVLVDDQEEARESLSIVLANAGAKVHAAASSAELFNWLKTLQSGEFPDVLVSDIAMPEEDGYTVLKKFRTWTLQNGSFPLRHTPALALTAFAQREDRIKALTAGFQMHMTKPVSPEELIVVIAMMAKPWKREDEFVT